jgi:hypothetical protein
MILQHIACICASVVLTSSVATAQSPDAAAQSPASSVVEYTYDRSTTPWRVVSSRTTTGGRDVTIATVEAPNADGRMSPVQETVTEKTRSSPATEQTTQQVFVVDSNGRRTLFETTDSQRVVTANGDTDVSHTTVRQDINGRAEVKARTLEQTRRVAPGTRRIETTVLLPDPNAALREALRTDETERRVDPRTVVYDSAQLSRDVNGRWLTTETRRRESRETSASERVQEQTIQRLDVNGRVAPVERTVVQASTANGREEEVTETFAPYLDRLPASGSGLTLSARVTRTTTKSADGGSSSIEEVEARNPAAPGDPMRVTRRIVTTIRSIGADRTVTEREVFERDVNGRLQRISSEVEESSGK